MITVTIRRSELVKHGACASGLALFDSIAALQSADDPRRLRRIRIPWCELADAWLAVGASGFVGWLRAKKLVPIADLSGANLRGANLRGADLSGADLYGADLSGADLYGADLSDANLSGADLYSANLHGADLSGASLRGASLRGANLSDANLHGADLYGANLSDADLSDAFRYSSDPGVPGWTLENGVLRKADQ